MRGKRVPEPMAPVPKKEKNMSKNEQDIKDSYKGTHYMAMVIYLQHKIDLICR